MISVWSIVIIVIVALVVLLIPFMYYNRFVTLSQRIKNSKSQISVQLKKRADLVPNLVNMVKGYMKHEREVLTEVTKARTSLMNAKDFGKKVAAGNQLQDALKSLFAVAENYPDLKASQNFLQLQQEVASIEDKIAYARQYFNDSIMSYNTMIERIPGMWFAGIFGFKKEEYFEIPEEEKAVVEVKFD
jgi:LemA protein